MCRCFVLLFALLASRAIHAADEPLALQVVPNQQPNIIEYDKPFHVALTNTTGKPLRLWNYDTRAGYQQLEFEFVSTRTGAKHLVQRPKLSEQEWSKYQRSMESDVKTMVIAPGETGIVSLNFGEDCWDSTAWQGFPNPNSPDAYQLTAHWSSANSADAAQQQIWTGKLKSPAITIKFVASELKTPQHYIQRGMTAKAIELMTADPKLINQADGNQCMPLHDAARYARLDAILWLLNAGADVNAEAYNHFTPLHLAGKPEVIDLLLQKKPDLTKRHQYTDSPLHAALEKWHQYDDPSDKKNWREIIDHYRKAGAEIDLTAAIYLGDLDRVKAILTEKPSLADNFHGHSPLRLAASLGQLDICRYLIDTHHVDVNDFERGVGYPILKEALAHPQVVKLLIDRQADLKKRITWRGGRTGVWIIGDNATLLHHAADDGVPEAINLLLDAGIDLFDDVAPTLSDDKHVHTALDVATYFGKADNLEAMLKHPQFKARPQPDRDAALEKCLAHGVVPGYLARKPEQAKLVKALLDHGANPRATLEGKSAMQRAVESIYGPEGEKYQEKQKIVGYLRDKGVPLTLYGAVAIGDEAEVKRLLKLYPKSACDRNSVGYPAIHLAASLNQLAIVKALLQAVCDVNLRSNSDKLGYVGDTPLHRASSWGHEDVVKLLIEAGADVNARNSKQITPLHETYWFNFMPVAKLLLDHGADPDAKDDENKTTLDHHADDHHNSHAAMAKLFEKYRKKQGK
ncbi:MAG: ankyrin repeat domain-containing protein [Gemmatales bacterium]